jgi:phthalate 4,5-cis-dihydrodiol dehydrogenase
MLPTLMHDPRVVLSAAADPRPEARARFAADFLAPAYESVEELCANAAVDVVYIATPHQYHAEHALLAAAQGKHILVEKPMALTLDDCRAMIGAASAANVRLVIGHSHSHDAPIERARELIESGAFGAVRMINAFNYTDFLRRPRRPEELDTTRGGGAVFNQAPHQVDIARRLAGTPVLRVHAATGNWDSARPTEGAYAALLTCADGAFAALTYSGYGHFDSDTFEDGIGEMGQRKGDPVRGAGHHFTSAAEEVAFKGARNYGGSAYRPTATDNLLHQHFGSVIVSCERADLRPGPNGVMIYENGAARLDALPPPAIPRIKVIDELYDAIVHGRAPVRDGAWGLATLEVCLAILASARTGREARLTHQGGLR